MGTGRMPISESVRKLTSQAGGISDADLAKYHIKVDNESFSKLGISDAAMKKLRTSGLAQIMTRIDNVGLDKSKMKDITIKASNSKSLGDNMYKISAKGDTLLVNAKTFRGVANDQDKLRSNFLSNVSGYAEADKATRKAKAKITYGANHKETTPKNTSKKSKKSGTTGTRRKKTGTRSKGTKKLSKDLGKMLLP